MSNVFQDLSEVFKNSCGIIDQMTEGILKNKTVIVQPQIGKDAEEATELATNWKSRERKQLFDNLFKGLS
jgi:hypothetical protein